MKNDEKAIIAGAGAVLTYLFLKGKEKEKEKKVMNVPDLSISPPIFYA